MGHLLMVQINPKNDRADEKEGVSEKIEAERSKQLAKLNRALKFLNNSNNLTNAIVVGLLN